MQSQKTIRFLDDIRAGIEQGLQDVVAPTSEGQLYDALRYALNGKGKRIRPTLTMLSGTMVGADHEALHDAALAIEIFHSFTLIHDDIMDNSELRRGRETIHVKWDVSTAILVGDLMLGMSFDLLTRSEPSRTGEILRLHSDTVRIVCEGQIMDMQFESRTDVSVDDYLFMIDQKTGRLISASLEIGALFGQVSDQSLQQLSLLGRDMGRAFQIQDDLLDLTANDSRWGKNIGGDLLCGKKTFLLASAIEQATGDELIWWVDIVASGKLAVGDVYLARERLESLGVLEAARSTVLSYSDSAQAIIAELPDSEARLALASLMESLKERRY